MNGFNRSMIDFRIPQEEIDKQSHPISSQMAFTVFRRLFDDHLVVSLIFFQQEGLDEAGCN